MPIWRRLFLAVVFGLAYYLAFWQGIAAPLPKSVSPWWPAAGVGMGGLFLLGWRFWPVIAIVSIAFHLHFGHAHRPTFLMWIAFVGTTEALLGNWLISRWRPIHAALDRGRDVVTFVTAAGLSSLYSVLAGAPVYMAMGFTGDQPFSDVAGPWWLGSMTGKLIFTATMLVWSVKWDEFLVQFKQRGLGYATLFATTFGLTSLIFSSQRGISSPYWLFPIIVWGSVRWTARGATTVATVFAIVAIAMTVNGNGPFTQFGLAVGTLRLQLFVGVLAVTGLVLAVAVIERSHAFSDLANRERLFRCLVENGEEAYCLLNADGVNTYASANIEHVIGLPVESFVGTKMFDYIHPDDLSRIQSIFAQIVKQPNSTTISSARVRHHLLGYRWMEGSSRNLLHDPQIASIVVNFRDISERQQALDAARASELSLATAQRVAGVGSWERDIVSLEDLTNNPLRWSDQTYRIFGYEPQAVPVNSNLFYKAVHPDDREGVRAAIAATLQSCQEYDMEHRIIRPDGVERIVHERGDVVCNANGRPIRLLGTVQDITDRKAAEARLLVQDERIRLLVRASPLSIVVYDRGGIVRVWNSSAERILGWEADKVIGMPHPLATPDQPGAWADLQATAIAGSTVTGRELKILRRDGKVVWANVSVAPLREAAGAITGTLWELADITEQRNLREQLAQSQKMESIGRLAGGIAHDFNNLLTIINGYSDLSLERLAATDPARELVREIRRAGQRAAGLTNQLLAFSRKSIITPVPLNLNAVLSELQKMLRRLIGEDIEMTTILDPGVAPVCVDPTQMEQIILNLAVNARDAMPAGGHLVVETRNVELDRTYSDANAEVAPGRYVLLAVSDSGLGMPPEVQERIFEPFFTTKQLGQGTGLGLATVYGIVKQNDGHIAVYSEIGRGTTFKIYLPRVDGTYHGDSITPIPTMSARGGKETILLVEDEEGVRRLTCTILESAGYRVLQARDGSSAIEIVQTSPGAIQLLLTDVVMPRLSGHDLAKQLRERQPDLRVLFMSGYTDHIMFRDGVAHNDLFLQKPFTSAGLLEKVREALDRMTASAVAVQ